MVAKRLHNYYKQKIIMTFEVSIDRKITNK